MSESEIAWPEGWASARLGNQRAFHYYRERKALCGRYELIQPPPEHVTFRIPPDPFSVLFTNSNDCKVCRRKMRADATPKPPEVSCE